MLPLEKNSGFASAISRTFLLVLTGSYWRAIAKSESPGRTRYFRPPETAGVAGFARPEFGANGRSWRSGVTGLGAGASVMGDTSATTGAGAGRTGSGITTLIPREVRGTGTPPPPRNVATWARNSSFSRRN